MGAEDEEDVGSNGAVYGDVSSKAPEGEMTREQRDEQKKLSGDRATGCPSSFFFNF